MLRGCRLQSNRTSVGPALGLRPNRGFKSTSVDRLGAALFAFLVDTFRRRHNYLRISLTEKCNLRCFYCMPSEGVELSPREHILTDDEVIRLAKLFVQSGVTKIRLTGGEPTVRKGLGDIISRLNELREFGLESIGMTSNGIALARRLPSLVENGLTHLNLSLDTLDPFKFEIMTRRRGHEVVLRSLDAALASGLQSVKLNVVIVQGLNDHEALDFLELTRDRDLSVRFIEFMPFTGNKWDRRKMAPDELNEPPLLHDTWNKGSFGFISSMSDHFCGSCNRLRLTADGQIKVCLFDAKEISLRDRMREGSTDEELLQTIGFAVQGKKEKHAGMEDIDVVTNRPMILIGDLGGSKPRLTHLDDSGKASMVDAKAKARSKGDVFMVAKLAAIMGCKRTSDLIPLCHPLQLSDIAVTLHAEVHRSASGSSGPDVQHHPAAVSDSDVGTISDQFSILCRAEVACEGKTGVEMEALTAVSIGLLTVWDMLKAVAGKEMTIGDIVVSSKEGGKSGDFHRVQ
ncbi:uncharacterized protein B0H18DRAFT_1084030 [Fomitopsis serialis]|uniref:uncharacterized protein n=1 Tax=Fomitopsis serialis TaxID=139415 RepID=UPI002007499F|nr:uncharacterized protein B0H18DRAFT_1084030 [Neoantrodia serialis]KAH9929660.1 hypothetical protein B0H18DRAFT_1084030 [Neoantrodia serialis]